MDKKIILIPLDLAEQLADGRAARGRQTEAIALLEALQQEHAQTKAQLAEKEAIIQEQEAIIAACRKQIDLLTAHTSCSEDESYQAIAQARKE